MSVLISLELSYTFKHFLIKYLSLAGKLSQISTKNSITDLINRINNTKKSKIALSINEISFLLKILTQVKSGIGDKSFNVILKKMAINVLEEINTLNIKEDIKDEIIEYLNDLFIGHSFTIQDYLIIDNGSVPVDIGIIKYLRIINDMGFITLSSCSGMKRDHIGEEKFYSYINFEKRTPSNDELLMDCLKKAGFSVSIKDKAISGRLSEKMSDSDIKKSFENLIQLLNKQLNKKK